LSGPLAGFGGAVLGGTVGGLAGTAPRGRKSNFVPQRGQTKREAPLTASASNTWVQTGLGQWKVDGMAVGRLTLGKRMQTPVELFQCTVSGAVVQQFSTLS
jgi:hypothetical protein